MTGRPRAGAREALPVAGPAAGPRPSATTTRLTGPGLGVAARKLPTAGAGRFRCGRRVAGAAISAVVVAAIFGFALPHVASYRSVWASVQMMAWPYLLLVVTAAAASLVTGWLVICAILPSVRLREAAVVNLGSSAVASTLPAGGALAMGISWTMLSGWGVSGAEYVLYTLVSGIWNVFARLGLPVIAVLLIVMVSRPQTGLLAGAAAGLVVLIVAFAGFRLLLRRDSFALRADAVLQRALAMVCRLVRRAPPPANGFLQGFREQASGLLAARGWRITAATAAASLMLWLVLLASVRGVGLSQSQVPWQTCLAAFAFVRLLTVLPVTPGGIGITELGLVSILTAGAGHNVAGRVMAAVLLYRALTYLAPIPVGALACVAWRYAPALNRGNGRSWPMAEPGHAARQPAGDRMQNSRKFRPQGAMPGPTVAKLPGSLIAQSDGIGLGDTVGLDGPQSLAQPLPSLSQ
jgi:putative heme transporter